jgi:hypothetical protein
LPRSRPFARNILLYLMHQVRMDIDVTRNFPHRETFLHHQFDSISFKFSTKMTAFAPLSP